jgi:hypothetical protein
MQLYDFYKTLIRLKKENDVFESETFTLTVGAPMKKIVVTSQDENIVALGNFDVKSGSIIPGFPHLGTWYDYFTGQSLEVTDLAESITLEAGEYRLFTDVYSGIPEDAQAAIGLKVYPNPGTDFTFAFSLENGSDARLEAFDISGRPVALIFDGNLDNGPHQIRWSAPSAGLSRGMYLLKITTREQSAITHFIVR